MTKDEALRLAWDALEDIGDEWGFTSQRTVPKRKEALTAIKEALAQPEHGWTPERIAGMARLKEAQDKKLAQPEQEPVAYINVEQRKLEWAKYMSWDTPTVVNLPKIPLYTTPPQRTWVGLTNEERKDTLQSVNTGFVVDASVVALAIEAKLKEKNG